jgi:hypothetical protein
MQGQPDLFQVVRATHAGRGFTDFLNGGQQKTDEHSDDRNHHQQFDERERFTQSSKHGNDLQRHKKESTSLRGSIKH